MRVQPRFIPAELVGSERVRRLIDELRSQVDLVLFDSPPLMPVTDAAVLASRVDGVVLVVDVGRTRFGAARQAQLILKQVGANVVGVVINRITARSAYGYYYHYYQYQYSGDGHRRQNGRLIFGKRPGNGEPQPAPVEKNKPRP